MSENVLKTLQQLVQDVIAPDVRELKVRVASLEKQMDANHQALSDKMDLIAGNLDNRIGSLESKMETQFKAIMAAISESKAQNELTSYKLISSLAERVAVLEARRAS
jgi:outer membrane murein-binding lipoprotein Lpp